MAKDNNRKFPRLWEFSICNVNTFSRVWHTRLTLKQLIAVCAIGFIVITALGTTFIASTPLKAILPGYLSNTDRATYEQLSFKVDSLSALVDIQNNYLNNFAAIFTDDLPNETIPQMLPVDSISLIPVDSLLPTSEVERRFAKQYEQRELLNVSVLTPIAADGMIFYRPVASSAKLSDSQPRTDKSINLITSPEAPVSSIYQGTVISISNEPGSGGLKTVIVQHPHDFVSIYSGLSHLYVNQGEKISAGTRIGATSKNNPMLRLTLYHNGSAIYAPDYISL